MKTPPPSIKTSTEIVLYNPTKETTQTSARLTQNPRIRNDREISTIMIYRLNKQGVAERFKATLSRFKDRTLTLTETHTNGALIGRDVETLGLESRRQPARRELTLERMPKIEDSANGGHETTILPISRKTSCRRKIGNPGEPGNMDSTTLAPLVGGVQRTSG